MDSRTKSMKSNTRGSRKLDMGFDRSNRTASSDLDPLSGRRHRLCHCVGSIVGLPAAVPSWSTFRLIPDFYNLKTYFIFIFIFLYHMLKEYILFEIWFNVLTMFEIWFNVLTNKMTNSNYHFFIHKGKSVNETSLSTTHITFF